MPGLAKRGLTVMVGEVAEETLISSVNCLVTQMAKVNLECGEDA